MRLRPTAAVLRVVRSGPTAATWRPSVRRWGAQVGNDGDGVVAVRDFIIMAATYGAQASDERYDPKVDLNADGVIDALDYGILARCWGGPPGPSGLTCAGTEPCP